jgi:uncharacterized delta-60 repeat protein
MDRDGTVLVAGQIWINNNIQKSVVRLFADGSPDSSFDAASIGDAYRLGVQPDGKIIVSGIVNGIGPIPTLTRLHPDGKVDSTFDAGIRSEFPQLHLIAQLFTLSDGKVLITGGFNQVNEIVLPMMARLNGDFEVRITDMQMLAAGKVRLTSTSRKGKTYVVEFSDDLIRWTVLGTYTASANSLQTEDTAVAQAGRRYYRIVQGADRQLQSAPEDRGRGLRHGP